MATRHPDTLRVPAFKRKKSLKLKVKAKRKLKKRLSPRLKRKTTTRAKVLKMKKKTTKKVSATRKPRPLAPTPREASPRLQPIGMVTHYYDRLGVGVLKLSGVLRLGDRLRLKGKTGEFDQVVQSMQIEHQTVSVAPKGSDIGLKVDQAVKTDAVAYKIPYGT